MPLIRTLQRRLFRWAVMTGVALAAAPWPTHGAPATAPIQPPLPAGDHVRGLVVDGRRRSYLVHVPPTYDPARATPVVVAFHGALMNGAGLADFSGLSDKADAAGFVVVYPNGLGFGRTALFFNASAKPVPGGQSGPADDVRFTAAVLDDLARVVTVDPRRVFATGMSNGGMMAHRVGAELADRFAAIAPVAGTLALPALHLSRPVPVILFHGSADGIVPWAGPGDWSPATMQFRSVPDTVRAWRDADGCAAEGTTATVPDRAGDGTRVTVTTYAGGRDGAEVVVVRVGGGGHTWPGMPPPVAWIGRSTANVSANDLMWDFFQRHPMPTTRP